MKIDLRDADNWTRDVDAKDERQTHAIVCGDWRIVKYSVDGARHYELLQRIDGKWVWIVEKFDDAEAARSRAAQLDEEIGK